MSSPKDVEYKSGVLEHVEDPELRLSFKQLAGLTNTSGGPIVGRAAVNPAGVGTAFALHIVDVEVDPETGKVDILRYTVSGRREGGASQLR